MKIDAINTSRDILNGTPVFKGTRVPVKNLFDYIEEGESLEDFLEGFPSVKKEQAIKVLEYAESLIMSTESFK